MIISISGKIGSGKDTIGMIIQYLIFKEKYKDDTFPYTCNDGVNRTISQMNYNNFINHQTNKLVLETFQIHKWAGTLKDIVCLLINCTIEQLENADFKNTELSEKWWFNNIIPENGFGTKLINWDKHLKPQKMTPRLLLQLLGTDCGRNIIHPNIWVNSLMSKYNKDEKQWINKAEWDLEKTGNYNPSQDAYPNWIITDTRFPNELKAVKDKGGISIRVNRPKERELILINANSIIDTRKTLEPQHESETALDNAKFDYVINNDGTIEELIETIKELLIKEKIINN